MPKGQSEAANRRTDNAMAKRKRTNVGRYQGGNQKPQIVGQTMPWQNEKGQMLEDNKGQSEAANRRTDNAMSKRKRTNVGQYQRGNQKP